MPILGAIADDYTGATDLANALRRQGFRASQMIGVPAPGAAPEADVIVVALRTRAAEPQMAVDASLAALRWLRLIGSERCYFKFCSTFDSTPRGNIGPVIEALMTEVRQDLTVVCPSLPENGRTVYLGHLFVDDDLLSSSGMRNHPLTPMTESNVVTLLAQQTSLPAGLVREHAVVRGIDSIRRELERLRTTGIRLAVVDAISDADLASIAGAVGDLPFIAGSAGLAAHLCPPGRATGSDDRLRTATGHRVVLAGSASEATRRQLRHVRDVLPLRRLDAMRLDADYEGELADVVTWVEPRLGATPVVVHAGDSPDHLRRAQAALGSTRSALLIERALADIAMALIVRGARQFIVAGGETSGAVVDRLGIAQLEIGPEIDPGVPWVGADVNGERVNLALKSGNFGGDDLFVRAWKTLA